MSALSVADLLTPLDQYTTVDQEASLKDAFIALEGALRGQRLEQDPSRPRDFAVLVVDRANGTVLGRLTPWDLLRGLEPQQMAKVDALAMVEGYRVWRQPLSNLATKAEFIKVKNLVTRLHPDEQIAHDAPVDEAISRMLKHRFFSLIVLKDRKALGLVRIVELFNHVSQLVKQASGDGA